MVRELARWDPIRAQAILRWTVREALLAYLERLRDLEQQRYNVQMLVWASIVPHLDKHANREPPSLPDILKG
jgi:hypothetical protein